MSDEIEEALRRELQSQWVPFDEARAEDMVRAAADSGLAGTPRAWVAPLAAAAAVVVVGGGVALATAGGGGNSAAVAPGGPGGVGPSTGSNDYVVGPCSPVGSGGGVIGTAYPVPISSISGSVMPPIYTAVNEGTSAPDAPDAPISATATAVEVPPTAAGSPTELPASAPAPTVSYVPTEVGSDGTIHITRSDSVVICEVDPASGTTVGQCSTHRNAVICVGSGDCPDAASSAPTDSAGTDPGLVCVATDVGTATPPLPTGSPTGAASALPTETPSSSSADSFDISTNVAPGESKTFDGPDIPAGQKLVVTALIFHNPAADTGKLTINRGGEHLVTEALSNFRSLDMHFDDQPIVFDADHPVHLTIDCANSTDACSPEVLFSGQLVPAQH